MNRTLSERGVTRRTINHPADYYRSLHTRWSDVVKVSPVTFSTLARSRSSRCVRNEFDVRVSKIIAFAVCWIDFYTVWGINYLANKEDILLNEDFTENDWSDLYVQVHATYNFLKYGKYYNFYYKWNIY